MKKIFVCTITALFCSLSQNFAQQIGIRGVESASTDTEIYIDSFTEIAPVDSIAVQADSIEEEELSYERIDSDMDIIEFESNDSFGKNWVEEFSTASFGRSKTHWAGIGVHYSGLVGGLDKLSAPDDAKYLTGSARSIGVTFNLFNVNLYTSSSNFKFFSGLGFEFNNFNFDRKNTIVSNGSQIVNDDNLVASGVNITRSKLVTSYMNIPLLVEYRFNRAFVNAGVIGGLYLGGYTKIKTSDSGSTEIYKNRGKLHLRNFHYGFAVAAGYKNVGLSVNYYPHSIFRINQGPEAHQINVGLSFYK